MKLHKTIAICFLFSAVWGLSACTAAFVPPALPPDFSAAAQYTFGDFIFACTMNKAENIVTVIPEDTNAAGMTIACDGETVTFTQKDMTKSAAISAVDVTNPARVLWEVLDNVQGGRAETTQEDALYVYCGSCSAGPFTLSQNRDGSLHALTVPAAGITVIFH